MSKFEIRVRVANGKEKVGKLVEGDIWSKSDAIAKADSYTKEKGTIVEVVSIGIVHTTEDSQTADIDF